MIDQDKLNAVVKSVGKSFDTSKLLKLMEMFEVKVNEVKEISTKHQVRGKDSELKSIEIATSCKKLFNVMDKARMAAKRPYLDFCQSLDGMVSPIKKTLSSIEAAERKKCMAYRTQLLEEQRKAEEEAAKAAPKKMPKLGNLVVPVLEPKPIQPAAGKVETFAGGSASYETVYNPYLEDITKVPAKYLLVDWKLVKNDISAGIRKIPGIEIKEEMGMKVRS